MTGLAGLPVYLDLASAMGLHASIEKPLHIKHQGWTDSQLLMSLILMNLSGGDCVSDLEKLESDSGFCRVFRRIEQREIKRRERREMDRRWRKERKRTIPSPSAVFRYLSSFHDDKEIATLDQDATLVETMKRDALYSYKGFKAYQLFNTWWSEQELVLHTEFRDGNVPAGHEQLRVLKEALALLPEGIEKVRLRSDTAGYQHDLLRYCEKGENERFGRIEFAIGCDVTPEFKKAVRFSLINIPGRIIERSHEMLLRLVKGNPATELLIAARQRILALCPAPSG